MNPSDDDETFPPPTSDKPQVNPAFLGWDVGLAAAEPQTRSGTIFAGRYKLRETLGAGGMGVVFVADQTEPVLRRVAIKIIRANLPTDKLLARFEQERQALALMDHPNIAKIYDAGVADNTPYFVMELIKGVSITKYCDDAKLTPRQRLELFIPACQAVQHAHQKGIIHRDLKPSNIIVGLYDGRPVPKVIDFGVAKMSGPNLTEHSVYTEVGSIIGTLEYMSPEQAELNNLDIDTRTDIYALGVILYELLTGTVPFSRKELQSAGFAEMLRLIKEKVPSKPSTKLSSSASLPTVAANRHMEPAKLSNLVRGDLDWIVMKAMEKDRGRRYETANGFAMDVQRYLAGDAVLAAPPSAAYRLKKFVRRNRPQVIAVNLVFFALIAGVIGTALGLREANRQTDFARAQEADARKQEGIAQSETKRAIEFRNNALDAYRELTETNEERDTVTRLKAISNSWQALAQLAGTDEMAQAISAEGHYRVANLLISSYSYDEARKEYMQALPIYAKLTSNHPTVPKYRQNLARIHYQLGCHLAMMDEGGHLPEAAVQNRKAIVIQEKLVADFPADHQYRLDLYHSRSYLGSTLSWLEQPREAEEQHRKAIAIMEKLVADFPADHQYRSNLAASHSHLGEQLVLLDQPREAEDQLRKALTILANLIIDFPAISSYQEDFYRQFIIFRFRMHATGKLAASLPCNDRAIEILLTVHKKNPDIGLSRLNVPDLYAVRAETYDLLQRFTEAVKDWDRAIETSVPWADKSGYIASRAMSRFKAGMAVAEAVAEVAELTKNLKWRDGDWYKFACIYAVASGKVTDKKQEYGDRAMELLNKAVKAGYNNAANMKKDKDLDPLREREDFKKLLAELEAGLKK